jgi:hypothetical protein
VVISSDRAAPVVSMCVAYDVGSRNEKPSKPATRISSST